MPNNSATGGTLLPAAPAPLEGQSLDRFLQQVVAAVTGLDGTLVRPRWQKEPPNMPRVGIDWAAVGVMRREADTYASVMHSEHTPGADTVFRQEKLHVLVSFYGDTAADNAGRLREGLSVAQNREILDTVDMAYIGADETVTAPSLVNERWQYRVDLPMVFVRAIRRTYPVLNLLSASGSIVTDNDPQLVEPINVPVGDTA